MKNTQRIDAINQNDLKDKIYSGLFEQVPINIAIIDRDYNIVMANKNFEDKFGEWKNQKCYSVYKNRQQPCEKCMALLTFEDGLSHVDDELGRDRNGKPARYVIHTAPIKNNGGEIQYVIEMSTDITEIKQLQQNYQILFERVPCNIAVMDTDFRIVRANTKFRETYGDSIGEKCFRVYKKRDSKCKNCPAEMTFRDGKEHQSEQKGITKKGKRNYYVVNTAPLARKGEEFAHVIEISTDLTEIKKLEKAKLESERMAAVGNTVAGLAHGVKNVLTGIQGGMYSMKTGLERGDAERILGGWNILDRNIERINVFIKDFLSFSKGDKPSVELINPAKIAREVVLLYKDPADREGVELSLEIEKNIPEAYFDPEGLHTCIANLISNAIDACLVSDKEKCRVTLRVIEKNRKIIFEVEDDGIGMDYEIKQKVFTNFFSTKGTKGTGIGLLTTRKIINQHNGEIKIKSVPGKGSIFQMMFSRKNLKN